MACDVLFSLGMQPTLLSKVHAFYDRVVHGAKAKRSEGAVVRKAVRDSPSQRITRPMAVADGDADEVGLYDPRDVEPMSVVERDASDRADGENWAESAVEHAIDTLPAEKPLSIDDEPTARH